MIGQQHQLAADEVGGVRPAPGRGDARVDRPLALAARRRVGHQIQQSYRLDRQGQGGAAGHLIIRGYSLDDLAGRTRFEDVAHLLFDGFFDDMPADLTRALGEARVAVFAETAAMDERLLKLNPVEAMRALWARLADGDGLDTALKLLAAPADRYRPAQTGR